MESTNPAIMEMQNAQSSKVELFLSNIKVPQCKHHNIPTTKLLSYNAN